MNSGETVESVLSRDETFRYQLLSRLKMDCEYFLGHGQGQVKHLWAGSLEDQIKFMKAIWKRFPEDAKPEWLSYEQILSYERKMSEVCGNL